jgi:hypothetical protein
MEDWAFSMGVSDGSIMGVSDGSIGVRLCVAGSGGVQKGKRFPVAMLCEVEVVHVGGHIRSEGDCYGWLMLQMTSLQAKTYLTALH